MGRADQYISEGETVIERTQMARTANILLLLYVGAVLALVGAAVIALGVVNLPVLVPLAAGLPVALAAIMLGVAELRRYADAYVFTNEKVIHVSGILNLDTTTIYFTEVTHTTVKQDLIGRILGHGDVIVDTAGQGGAEMVLTGVRDPEHFQQLLEQKSGHNVTADPDGAPEEPSSGASVVSAALLSDELARLQRRQHRVEQAYQDQKLDEASYHRQWYVLEGRIQEIQDLLDRIEAAQ